MFVVLILEAQITSKKAFTYYFVAVFIFQAFTYILVIASFEFRKNETTKESLILGATEVKTEEGNEKSFD